MKILITGGSGFIGSHLTTLFEKKGFDITILDIAEPNFPFKGQFIQENILNSQSLQNILQSFEYVIHLAAIADVNKANQDPNLAFRVNTQGTFNLLEAAHINQIKHFLYASTIWVYSNTLSTKVNESTPLLSPDNIYTSTKLSGEYLCHNFKKFGLNTTILRFGIPYGLRARKDTVVPSFCEKAIKKQALIIKGDGEQYRKFIHISDLVQGIFKAFEKGPKSSIYNLDGKENITVNQLVEHLKFSFKDLRVIRTPSRSNDFKGKDVSSQLAFDELSWQAKVPFKEGINRFISELQKSR